MGFVNKPPDLNDSITGLEKRIRALEASKRFTIPVVSDWRYCPMSPQSGDIVMDGSTRCLYVYCVDWEATLRSAVTTDGTYVSTLNVSNRFKLKANQLIAVINGLNVYYAIVSSSYTQVSNTGSGNPGNVSVLFPLMDANTSSSIQWSTQTYTVWSRPPNPTTLPIGTVVRAATWRQLVTSNDLIAKQGLIAAGTLGTTSFGGANSAPGFITGGIGENVCLGYSPRSV